MTRMRAPHSYHQAKQLNPETFCSKCSTGTSHVCEWCGACQACHKGATEEKGL